MSKILAFLSRHTTLLCLALIAVAMFFMPEAASAQPAAVQVPRGATGPFQAFLERGTALFAYTRNALFVVAAFAFVVYAWTAIQEGKIEWNKLLYLIVALVLLGVAGFIVSYLAGGQGGGLTTDFQNLQDVQWR
jgi:uncharacterized membrane protein YozB (DUF420 family)